MSKLQFKSQPKLGRSQSGPGAQRSPAAQSEAAELAPAQSAPGQPAWPLPSADEEWAKLWSGEERAAAEAEEFSGDPMVRRAFAESPRGRPLWGKYSAETGAWQSGHAQPSWWMLLCEMDFTLGHAVRVDAFELGLAANEAEAWRDELAERIERADTWMEKVERLPRFSDAARMSSWWMPLLLARRFPLLGDSGAEGSQSALSHSGPVDFLPPQGFAALKTEGKAALAALRAHMVAPEARRAERSTLPQPPFTVRALSSSPGDESLCPAMASGDGEVAVVADEFPWSSDEVAARLEVIRARVHALALAGRLAWREGRRAGRRVRLFSEASVAAIIRARAG